MEPLHVKAVQKRRQVNIVAIDDDTVHIRFTQLTNDGPPSLINIVRACTLLGLSVRNVDTTVRGGRIKPD